MQTVDADFLAEQNKTEQKYYSHVVLYRKTWDGSNYVLDAGTNIDDYIVGIGKISQSSDENFQQFKIDNLDITVNNKDRKWGRSTPGGFWDGFIPEFSEITVEFGYIDDSSAEHGLIIYLGILNADSVREDINKRTAVIHIRGYGQIPDRFSAEDLSDNQRTGIALIGAVNGVNTTFTTSDNGVGIIRAVYLDGTEFVVNDYATSILNDASNPAIIEMDLPPASGSMTADYVFWYQDKTIGFLIEQLIEHAGITNHEIEEVIFENSIIQIVKYDTKTEFDLGTKENVYTQTSSPQLFINIINHSETLYTATINVNLMGMNLSAQSFVVNSNNASFTFGLKIEPYIGLVSDVKFWLSPDIAGEPDEGTILGTVTVAVPASSADYFTFDITANLVAGTTYWLVWGEVGPGAHKYRTSLGTGTYTDGTGMSKIYFASWVALNKDFIFSVKPIVTQNTWMSDTVDTGGTLVSWGVYNANTSPNGIFALYTKTKTAGEGGANPGSWPATFIASEWDLVTGGVINSDLKQYIRFAVVITYTPTITDFFPNSIPYINQLKLIFNTSTFSMNLSNFTGLSINGAIEDLALMSDYQFGFKSDGKFYFKSKGDGSSVDMEIYGVTKIVNYRPDWDRLKNYVTANFGNFSKTVSSVTEGEPAPNSINKYGLRKMDVSGGNILDDESIDIATGAAEVYYERYKTVKRRGRISVKMFPQLEVGDITRLKYFQGGMAIMLFNGYLFDSYVFADDINMLDPYDLTCRIMKIEFDINKKRNGGMTLDLLEV